MYWHGMGFGAMPIFIMGFFWLAVIVVAVVLIVKLAGGGVGTYKHGEQQSHVAEDLLKQRYARGEITKEQYDSMLSDLRR
jgi:putative membrane protein